MGVEYLDTGILVWSDHDKPWSIMELHEIQPQRRCYGAFFGPKNWPVGLLQHPHVPVGKTLGLLAIPHLPFEVLDELLTPHRNFPSCTDGSYDGCIREGCTDWPLALLQQAQAQARLPGPAALPCLRLAASGAPG